MIGTFREPFSSPWNEIILCVPLVGRGVPAEPGWVHDRGSPGGFALPLVPHRRGVSAPLALAKPRPPAHNSSMKWLRPLAVSLLGVAAGLLVAAQVPHRWCMREGGRWFDGDPALQDRLARGVERSVLDGIDLTAFHTGSSQFNGEWLFGTYLMAGLGYGQLALQRPEWRERAPALIRRCIEHMLEKPVREFDRVMWKGADPLDALPDGGDHAAFLGYFNVLLGLHRQLDPQSPYTDLHDRISAHLLRRLAASKWQLLESYPDEVYPVDNCAVLGGLALHEKVTGAPRSEVLARALANLRARYRDERSGLLYQAVDANTGEPIDHPRGSGTTLGLYLLAHADLGLARDLHRSVAQHLAGRFMGFGAVREYPEWIEGGDGDIDSGPVIMGYGVSPTGFHLAGCRMFGDRAMFCRLYASAHFAGSPLDRGDRREYVTGGPLGNAILFAMFTAPPEAKWP